MPLEFLSASGEDVIISDTAVLDLSGDNTCMSWIKLGTGGSPTWGVWGKWRGTGSDVPYQLRMGSSVSHFRCILTYGHTTGGEDNLNCGVDTILRGVWSHVALRLSGTTAEIFMEGVPGVSETQDASGLINSDGDFFIGSRGGTQEWEGLIDDLRIYNRALSDAEIQTIFTSRGKDNIVNSLVGRWLMNEGAIGTSPGATAVRDIGSNGLNSSSVTATPTYEDGILAFRRKVV